MIVGIGFDLVDIAKIDRLLNRGSALVLHRLLSERELAIQSAFASARRRLEWTAGRFAAKEAFLKAAGIGIGGTIGMADIEVLTDPAGRPIISESPLVREMLPEPFRIHLSITHTDQTAGAVVIIEQ